MTEQTAQTGQEEQITEVDAPVVDTLAMSDEDFLKLNGPETGAATAASETATEETTTTTTEAETGAGEGEAEATAAAAEASAEADAGGEAEAEAEPGAKVEGEAEVKADDKTEEKPDATGSASAEADPKDKSGEDVVAEPEAVDSHEAQLKKILAPFKANGRDVQVKNADEAIKLMQMGANYTRKMQELQPHRKIVTMLSNNDLLDEGKLSFLIDLERGNPEAIKKLIKDKGIDVLDIDTSVEPAYEPGSHIVDDAEVTFRTATEELISQDGGKETISEIHSKWDDASKEALWNKPEILATIHEQRTNGAYAQITAEMDRQITLGNIPANTPFLEAYVQVGDAMVAAAKAAAGPVGEQPGQKQEMSGPAPQPVATRAAAPKPTVANGDKAKAASPTRSGQKKAEVLKNPLAQSDEEFLNLMNGRV